MNSALNVLCVLLSTSRLLYAAKNLNLEFEQDLRKEGLAGQMLPEWSNDPCRVSLPSALSFVERLAGSIQPREVVIFTGGDSLQRRLSGFSLQSGNSIRAFAAYHGYQQIFVDELDYNKALQYGGYTYRPQWHRVFALPSLRLKYPNAKYYIWMDDDVLVPYQETDMLNHYINLMEADPTWHMLYGDEAPAYVMNSGFFIMKNTDFCFDFYSKAIDLGTENNGHLSREYFLEQEAVHVLRRRHGFETQIRIIPHRNGPYNFNTFARQTSFDPPGSMAQYGDAFVHFLGQPANEKLRKMNNMIRDVSLWRSQRPRSCAYPVPFLQYKLKHQESKHITKITI